MQYHSRTGEEREKGESALPFGYRSLFLPLLCCCDLLTYIASGYKTKNLANYKYSYHIKVSFLSVSNISHMKNIMCIPYWNGVAECMNHYGRTVSEGRPRPITRIRGDPMSPIIRIKWNLLLLFLSCHMDMCLHLANRGRMDDIFLARAAKHKQKTVNDITNYRNMKPASFLHRNCRNGIYPQSKIERTHVPDQLVSWTTEFVEYRPKQYESPTIEGKPWADPKQRTCYLLIMSLIFLLNSIVIKFITIRR